MRMWSERSHVFVTLSSLLQVSCVLCCDVYKYLSSMTSVLIDLTAPRGVAAPRPPALNTTVWADPRLPVKITGSSNALGGEMDDCWLNLDDDRASTCEIKGVRLN